jgi:predicted phosphoribosyltransferase
MFKDRLDAALRLSTALNSCKGQHPLVLAIPRGAVPMAQLIARHLEGDMDVVLVRKLRAPLMPEVAVGAINENGRVYLNHDAPRMGADTAYLEQEKAVQLATLRQRRRMYSAIRQPPDMAGRTVIVVDDGMATGATMIAALESVRQKRPSRLVCAVPVASAEALAAIRTLADDVVCLSVPDDFEGVGQFYRDFAQVTDDEVIKCLQASSTRGAAP